MINVKYYEDVKMVAMCDEDLLGKTLEDEKLKIVVSEHFYKGKIMNKEEILKVLKTVLNANIVGKESVELVKELNFIKDENINYIENVPHAIVVCI